MAKNKKIYVVLKGKNTGFFYDYDVYREQIKGYSYPISRSFKNEQKALEYYKNKEQIILESEKEFEKTRKHNEEQKKQRKIKYYVVIRGRETGIYNDYKLYKKQIIKFSGAIHQSFKNKEAAIAYYEKKEEIIHKREIEEAIITKRREERRKIKKEENIEKIEIAKRNSIDEFKKNNIGKDYGFAYTDGSFNEQKQIYGYGGFISYHNKIHFVMGSGNKLKYIKSTNVSGELLGCIKIIEKAIELNIKNLIVFHDYDGIKTFASPDCKKKHGIYEKYYNYINSIKDKINIEFIRVKSHSTDVGNKIVDNLAKCSVGLKKCDDKKIKEFNELALSLKL